METNQSIIICEKSTEVGSEIKDIQTNIAICYIIPIPISLGQDTKLSPQLTCSRRSAEDEALMSAVLGGRRRGFLLEIVEKTEKGDSSGGSNYPGWKRVVTKLASLQELRESLQGLSLACTDISSDKVGHNKISDLPTVINTQYGCNTFYFPNSQREENFTSFFTSGFIRCFHTGH